MCRLDPGLEGDGKAIATGHLWQFSGHIQKFSDVFMLACTSINSALPLSADMQGVV